MALVLSEFTSVPDVLTPNGGPVRLFFTANATGSVPSHMQARFWIDDNERFVFEVDLGVTDKEVFFPAVNQRVASTATPKEFGPIEVVVVPEGQADPGHVQPLQINLELLGFDAAGNRTGQVVNEIVLITIDTLGLFII